MTKRQDIPTSWRLLLDSLKFYKRWWRLMLGIVLVLAIPAIMVNSLESAAAAGLFTLLAVLFNVVMSLALIWAVYELDSGRSVTVKRAYYEGTAKLVQFIVIDAILSVQLIPLALALNIYQFGVVQPGVSVTLAEKGLVAAVALALAAPSVWLLSRSVFSIYALQEAGMTPRLALKASSRAVSGNMRRVLARLVVLAVVMIIVLSMPTILVAALAPENVPALVLLQLFGTLLVLPLSNIYLHKLYRSLA